jgi:hypothetical protein
MAAHLDLSKAHLTRRHGDILAVYTWVNNERAMVLAPALRKHAAWYCLLESAAYKYDNPRYLARQSAIAADVLGIEPNTRNWSRIASIINEGLPDLIRMPSEPENERGQVYGNMILRADGVPMGSIDLRREIVSGVTYQ